MMHRTARPWEWQMPRWNGQCSGLMCRSCWWWILFRACTLAASNILTCLQLPQTSWLLLCRMYSELISAAIASGGPHASRTSQVKLMRSCKKVALKLIETFVEKCDDTVLLAQQIVPAMMDPILGDYARNVPDARCARPPRPFLAQMLRGPSQVSWMEGI